MGTARLVKELSGFMGNAALYELDPPLKDERWSKDSNSYEEVENRFVVASAVKDYLVFETYLFPADETGKIVNWGELPGSLKETVNHAEALREAGYEIINETKETT